MLETTVTKITPTSEFNPAVGKTYIVELSNGERFPISADALLSRYCYDENRPVGEAFDNEFADELVYNDFQNLVNEGWD